MPLGDVVDEFHDQYGLSHSCTTKQPDLSPFGIRLEQVDDFDAGKQNFSGRGEIFKLGRFAMDGICSFLVELFHTIYGLSYHIHQASFDLIANGHGDWMPCKYDFHSPTQSVRAFHRYGSDGVFTDVLLYFHNQGSAILSLDSQCIVDAGKFQRGFDIFPFKVDIHYRPDDL